jgi:hypothetical protein
MIFTANCKVCHRSEFFSSPEALALRGPLFVERWREDTLASLFTRMKGFMPPANVGPKLMDNEYIDIIAFMLQSNAYPVGHGELKADQLAGIQIVDKGGPQPVPNQSQVVVVGCLTPGPNGSMTLTQATEPMRTRTPEETTPEELKASGDRALGSATFLLRALDNLPPSFNVDDHKGQKVQAKGVLSRQTAGDRINVLSMAAVGKTCS